ncbi:MAG: hypothetical protein A2583_12130 [Bdellovibrionales bacterium RIFOXYD1_FULL_53_11]|nr:MAG: hypothetical protein A2583_12130 [Bdellovibrionales bacterium RIFOXYD1_FULL_53_11]
MKPPLSIALVHDWLTGMRGGEYVFEAITEIFPRSDLFTLVYSPGRVSPVLTTPRRHTSWFKKIPGIDKRYRSLLPLMPWTIGRFDLSGFDLVLSSSHCVAKGVRKKKGAVHVSYVHAPMRYMWDRYDDYFGPGRAWPHTRLAARLIRPHMQKWDRETSTKDRVDLFIANSTYIAGQLKEHYGRDSKVINPFADHARFSQPRMPGRYYLMVSAFAPYKKIDMAIEAFNRMKLPLRIIGDGQDGAKLKKAAGPTVDFLGQLSNSAIADIYAKCRAFVFPGLEDFGITPVEAMSAGAPVIAYRRGGVLDSVTDKTGVFFDEQTPEALMAAVQKIERGEIKIDEAACRAQAARFSRDKFQREYVAAVREAWGAAGKPLDILDERISTGWAGLTGNA